MSEIETLTDEEREKIFWREELGDPAREKALRIIDALAAECQEWNDELDARIAAQVAELTRERDEAVSNHDAIHEQLHDAESEVTRLTEALAAAARGGAQMLAEMERLHATVADKTIAFEMASKRADAAEARVQELEARIKRAVGHLKEDDLAVCVRSALEALRG